MSTQDRELGWDDTIEHDGADFVTLPAGEYAFTVIGFERGRHAGSPKLPPCNKAMLGIEIDGGEKGKATITENLFLHTKTEGLLCAFFRSIGARKSGEKVVMDWGSVVGTTGRAKVAVRSYQKDGETRTINQVQQWLDPKPQGYTEGTF
ncbi:hypothetical protein PDESU_03337 [Pontiella desulfatans]|uniref:DUF669 domain-containing protein n=1 Tax=Pontiella desulfatans TaxID=2750659 RepID=A0A6C2U3Y7_PONDE|nr:DUF669 domain-containing protein [Pontiella desulfatans]VGO14768.1 hypothetical protein PDESU_03337 [Pontiella desulfatans]